jgi:hypothetical protein
MREVSPAGMYADIANIEHFGAGGRAGSAHVLTMVIVDPGF